MTIPFTPSEQDPTPEITPTTGTIQGAGFSVLKARTQSNVTASLKAQIDQQNGWTLWWRNIADALRPAIEDLQQLLIDLRDNPEEIVGSARNIKMDNQRTFGTFLTEVWKAIKKQSGSDKTVDETVDALSELVDTVTETYQNSQDASEVSFDFVSGGSNLVRNASFENSLFQQAAGVFSTAMARTGSKSLRMTGTGVVTVNYTLLSTDSTPRNFSVKGGDIYYAEVWVRGDQNNNQTVSSLNAIRVFFQPYSADNVALTPSSFNLTAHADLKNGWTQLEGLVTMPADARYLTIKLQLTPGVEFNEKYFFDDIVLREVTVASTANAAAGTAQTAADAANVNANDALSYAGEVVSAGSNIVKNPGFETGRFAQLGSSFSTDQAHSDSRSLKITGNGLTAVSYFLLSEGTTPRTVSVSEGDIFYAEYWVRGAPTNSQTSGTGVVQMVFQPLNSIGASLTPIVLSTNMSSALNSGWVKVSDFVTMPTNAKSMTMKLQVTSGVNFNQHVYFDDIVVREVTLASTANANASTAQTTANTASTNAANADTKATTAQSNVQTVTDGVVQAVDGGTASNNSHLTVREKLQKAWANIWDGLTGNTSSTSTSKLPGDVLTAGYNARAQANLGVTNAATANSNVQTVTDSVVQAVDGGTSSNNSHTTVKDRLQKAWANIWDGLNGSASASSLSKLPSDVFTVGAAARSRAELGVTNAGTANSNVQTVTDSVVQAVDGGSVSNNAHSTVKDRLQKAWANIWDGLNGSASAASTSKLPSELFTVGAAARSRAELGVTNAATADGKAVTAQTNVQTVTDSVAQAVDGTTATNNSHATVKSKLQLAWANIWDGLNGSASATNTSKLPSEVFTAGAAARSRAELGVTNAATADGKAVTAQNTTNAMAASANLCISPNFEDSTILRSRYSSGATLSYVTSEKFQGTQSLSWTVNSLGWNGPFLAPISTSTATGVRYNTKVGDTFNVKLKIKPGSSNSTTGYVRLFLRWWNTGSSTSTDNTATILNSAFAAGWQDMAVVATCPSGYDALEVFVLSDPTTPVNNVYYIDAVSVREESTAQAAQTNVQTVTDSVAQAVDGTTGTGNAHDAVKTKLKLAWANIWDGLNGSASATNTSKLPSEVFTAGAAARSRAELGVTNASTAQTTANKAVDYVQSGTNLIPDPGFESSARDTERAANFSTSSGTFSHDTFKRSGSRSIKFVCSGTGGGGVYFSPTLEVGETVPARAGSVFKLSQWVYASTSNTGANKVGVYMYCSDSAGVNTGAWVGNDYTIPTEGTWYLHEAYLTVPAGLDTVRLYMCSPRPNNVAANDQFWFDDIAAYEVTEAIRAVDNIVQAVDGGSTTGNAPATAKAKLQLAWANIWDGLTGNNTALNTSKLPSEVLTAGYNARSQANLGVTNAGTAQTTANTANSLATSAFKAGPNLIPNPSFEDTQFYIQTGLGSAYSTEQARTGTRSLRLQGTGTSNPFQWLSNTTTGSYGIPATAGDTFTFSVWVYGAATNTQTKANGMRLGFNVRNAANTSLVYVNKDYQFSPSLNGVWTQYTATMRVPDAQTTATNIQPYFQLLTPNSTEIYYIDDADLRNTTEAQDVVDNLYQSTLGGTSTGNAASSIKTNLQQAWANLWDGLSGNNSAVNSSKLPSEVLTAGYNARAQANLGVSNASTAQTSATNANARASAAGSQGSNLIPDGGFENVTIQRDGVNNTVVTSPAPRTGSRSMRLTGAATGYAYSYLVTNEDGTPVQINCTPGDVFYVEYWVMGDQAANTTSAGIAFLQFDVYKTDSTYSYLNVQAAKSSSGTWVKYSGYLTIPALGYKFNPVIYLGSGAGTNTAYSFDDIIIREVTHAQGAIDNLHQAVNGGSSTGNTIASVKSNLQLAWANIWDGLNGSASAANTSKLPSEVYTVGAAARARAELGITNAGTAQTTGDTTNNNIAQILGADANATGASAAVTGLTKTFTDLANAWKAVQELQSSKSATVTKGGTWSVNFANYASVTAAGFALTYSGSGTSTISIINGVAQWNVLDSLSRDAKLIYNTSTTTDFQSIRGTMSAPPQAPSGTTPYFYAVARSDSSGNSYVFARAYAVAFGSYRADIGYVLNGVETLWVTGVSLSWSLDMRFVAGVGTNKRTYQIWSGNSVVKEWDETYVNGASGTINESRSLLQGDWLVSRGSATAGTFTLTYDGSTTASIAYNATAATVKTALGNLGKGTFFVNSTSNGWYINPPDSTKTLTGTGSLTGGTLTLSQQNTVRRWGAIAQVRNQKTAGKVEYCSATDSGTPSVYGSTARMSRTQTATLEPYPTGLNAVPGSFFDTVNYESIDIDAVTSSSWFKVTTAKTYAISARLGLNGSPAVVGKLLLQKSTNGTTWTTVQYGTSTYNTDSLNGSWLQYLNANEYVRLAWTRDGAGVTAQFTGDSAGSQSYFSIAACEGDGS